MGMLCAPYLSSYTVRVVVRRPHERPIGFKHHRREPPLFDEAFGDLDARAIELLGAVRRL